MLIKVATWDSKRERSMHWPFTVRADPSSFGQIEEVVTVLLRFVAIYSLFDSLNIVFASGVKGAGDTRFVMLMVFVFSFLGLALPTYIAMVFLRLGLMAAWTIITIYVIIVLILYGLNQPGIDF